MEVQPLHYKCPEGKAHVTSKECLIVDLEGWGRLPEGSDGHVKFRRVCTAEVNSKCGALVTRERVWVMGLRNTKKWRTVICTVMSGRGSK